MTDLVPLRRALLSVSDKTGLVAFATVLAGYGIELLSKPASMNPAHEQLFIHEFMNFCS